MSRLITLEEHFFETLVPPPIEPWEVLYHWPPVSLRFAPTAAWRVYDEFHVQLITREEDGCLRVDTHLPLDETWVYDMLFSFGADVTILSPDELRTSLLRHTADILHHHEKKNQT